MYFQKVPTTVTLFLVYCSIFTFVFLTNQLSPVPSTHGGLHFDQALADLQTITANPHPYNSHANDIVREYILTRLTNITSPYPNAHLSSDLHSTATFFVSGRAVYFEGTNILVKIDGSDPNYQLAGGVLFSAHYDSVSTAPGVTDNGIGVATLMAMVQYFLEVEQPQKTVVFNFNNGEEDGLYGAHAYLEHPWSNITNTFLNIDGAAAGGRPIIFRSTSIMPLTAFTSPHIPHPHANVLSADAYARGVIRSSTDYQVYNQFRPAPAMRSMQGVDLAFYKHRAFYHTQYDSIPGAGVDGIEGAAKALWAMMEVVRGSGVALAQVSNGGDGVSGGAAAVYFDLFASKLILFPISALMMGNIVLLIVGPVIVVLVEMGAWGVQWARVRGRARVTGNGNIVTGGRGLRGSCWSGVSRWVRSGISYWFRFWVMLTVVVGLQIGLIAGYLMVGDKNIVYSSPYLVLASTLSLACLSTILIISVPSPSRFFRRLSPSSQHHGEIPPADAQKNSTLLQTYILTWLFLVVSTIAVGQLGIGGVYVVSAWNVGVLAGVMVGVVEGLVWGLAVGVVAGEVSEGETEAHGASELEGDGATEDTPLLRPQRASTDVQPVGRNAKQDGAFGWWFVQLLLVVPIPVILVSHIGLVLLGALPQTLVDGSSAAVVYAAISFLSILLVLPLAPFAHKVHGFVTCVILVIFLLSTAYAWTAFPFTMDAPLKVFFQQRVRLAPARSASMSSVSPASWLNASHSDYAIYAPVSAHTSLTGLSSFLESRIIAQLPSARGKDVSCAEAEGRAKGSGMETCTWEVDVRGEMGPDPVGSTWEEGWLVVNTTRIGGNTGRIAVRGVNARACSVYFNRPVRWWKVLEGEEGGMGGVMQSGYEAPEEGVNTLALWSRTWDREFAVEVGLVGEGRLDGRVGCEWAEYESGTVGIAGVGARIPALEEVLKYLPLWAVVSKVGSGLVQGWADFHV